MKECSGASVEINPKKFNGETLERIPRWVPEKLKLNFVKLFLWDFMEEFPVVDLISGWILKIFPK